MSTVTVCASSSDEPFASLSTQDDEVLARLRLLHESGEIRQERRPSALGLEELPRHDERSELGRRKLDLGLPRLERWEVDGLAPELQLDPCAGEEPANVILGAPSEGRRRELRRWRWHVRAHR